MIEYDDRIVKSIDRTTAVNLYCEHHPNLRWNTKNIGGIGARSIFFLGRALEAGEALFESDFGPAGISRMSVRECPCPASNLRPLEDQTLHRFSDGS
jgi:hypothetical protein